MCRAKLEKKRYGVSRGRDIIFAQASDHSEPSKIKKTPQLNFVFWAVNSIRNSRLISKLSCIRRGPCGTSLERLTFENQNSEQSKRECWCCTYALTRTITKSNIMPRILRQTGLALCGQKSLLRDKIQSARATDWLLFWTPCVASEWKPARDLDGKQNYDGYYNLIRANKFEGEKMNALTNWYKSATETKIVNNVYITLFHLVRNRAFR